MPSTSAHPGTLPPRLSLRRSSRVGPRRARRRPPTPPPPDARRSARPVLGGTTGTVASACCALATVDVAWHRACVVRRAWPTRISRRAVPMAARFVLHLKRHVRDLYSIFAVRVPDRRSGGSVDVGTSWDRAGRGSPPRREPDPEWVGRRLAR